ncbi:MAG: hypothetical protein WKF90_04520 [Pyrinomonadaceae bacterium]
MAETLRRRRRQRLGNSAGTRTESHFVRAGFGSHQGTGKVGAAADFTGSGGVGAEFGEAIFALDAQTVFEKNGCRYKRIRKRLKSKPNEQVYQVKKEVLGSFEQMSRNGLIDLYYGAGSRSQFRAERAAMLGSFGMKKSRCRQQKAKASIVSRW